MIPAGLNLPATGKITPALSTSSTATRLPEMTWSVEHERNPCEARERQLVIYNFIPVCVCLFVCVTAIRFDIRAAMTPNFKHALNICLGRFFSGFRSARLNLKDAFRSHHLYLLYRVCMASCSTPRHKGTVGTIQ